MTHELPRRLLRELAEREIPESYDCWPLIEARLGVSARRRSEAERMRWGLAAAMVVVLVLSGGTLLVSSRPQPVSAEALLDQAGAVSDGAAQTLRSYHITATTTFHLAEPGNGTTTVHDEETETWFGGAGRMRQETHSPEWSSITVTNGTDAWWSMTRGGQTYVAPANGIRFSDTALLNPLAPEGSNIASVLQFAQQRGCGSFQLQPEQTVAGRAAYVISVTHTFKEACLVEPSPSPRLDPAAEATALQRADEKKAAVATQESARPNQTGLRKGPAPAPSPSPIAGSKDNALRLPIEPVVDTFWIDKETFVPLKAVGNLGPKGTRTYEVTGVSFNIDIPDSTFEFSPPPGAEVLRDPGEMKKVLATR